MCSGTIVLMFGISNSSENEVETNLLLRKCKKIAKASSKARVNKLLLSHGGKDQNVGGSEGGRFAWK